MEPRLCLARVFLSWHIIAILLHFCVVGAFKPLSDNPDWMERDTRVKAKLCLLLYGIFTPIIPIMAYITADGRINHTQYDTVILVAALVSVILSIIASVNSIRRRTGKNIKRIAIVSYIYPIIVFATHVAMYKGEI